MVDIARNFAALLLAMLLAGCTDGATRIAYDIQAGAADLQHSNRQTYVIRHVPEGRPDGCGDAYKVQFTEESAIVIWCIDSRTGEVTSSHGTTYHLNFVKVPARYILEKQRGEPIDIELSKENGSIVVTDVH